MYARTKAGLPHAQRMENLTWRMMALALRRRREEEDRVAASIKVKAEADVIKDDDTAPRGRRIDKGKIRVEGFDDGKEDEQ